MHRILQRFSALLLDLNGTFMFGHDRFGPDHDYYVAYRELGGRQLGHTTLRRIVDSCVETLDRCYRDAHFYDSFPSVATVLGSLGEASGLPADERLLVERVVATHEAGTIPDEFAALLKKLSRTHHLAIVSNIWSRKDLYLAELKRAGVIDLFRAVVFSSEGTSMKPSRVLFDRAVTALRVQPAQAVVIGDSLRCDVAGADRAGLDSIWIDSRGKGIGEADPTPGWIIRDLRDLDPDVPESGERRIQAQVIGPATFRGGRTP